LAVLVGIRWHLDFRGRLILGSIGSLHRRATYRSVGLRMSFFLVQVLVVIYTKFSRRLPTYVTVKDAKKLWGNRQMRKESSQTHRHNPIRRT
jgi:hypothetical protein